MAEREGFEPSVRVKRTTVFETAPFNHSGISPCVLRGGAYILVPSDVNNGRAGIPPGGGAWPGIVFVGCHELTESAHTYITCALAWYGSLRRGVTRGLHANRFHDLETIGRHEWRLASMLVSGFDRLDKPDRRPQPPDELELVRCMRF